MKNIIISALVGISFLTSGFWVGLRFAPMPKKPVPAPVAATAAAKPPREAFTVATLKAASENMLSVNDALKAREVAIAAREKKVRQQEEEIVAERGALDRLHAHFRELYGEFQQRLQLVSDNEQAQLARQVEIFNSMDPVQVADMMRSLDDGTIVRMFSIMETKSLSKLVAAWKTKYPNDSPRLLIAMNGMGRVVAENKIVLPASPSPVDNSATPDANAAAPSDGTAPAATPDANANPAPDATDASQSSPPPAADSSAPPTDPNSANTPYIPSGNSDSNANTPSSSADANAPASTSPDPAAPPAPASAPDPTTPPAPAAPPAPASPDAPAAAPDATTPATPTQDSAPAPAAPASSTPSTASTATSDSTAPLDTPGETAAKAAAATRNAPGSAETSEPSEFTPPPAATRLAHDKPVRFASARNN